MNPSSQLVAADIGAGTGIGSRLLARGVHVLAIEPNADMRAAATPYERVEVLAGTAEHVILSPKAVRDLEAIVRYIFEQSKYYKKSGAKSP